jgi:predicted dehydrogenase
VLVEKPMALDEHDCRRMVDAAADAKRVLQVCHVYRYSTLFSRLHEVVASGELGKVVTIQLSENVAYWHYAHSYCRGHTRRSDVPMLLQKSCHDLDLVHWLAGAPPVRVSSFLRPTELRAENAPPDAPERCIDGCPHAATCPYDAVAMYAELKPMLQDLEMAEQPFGLRRAARLMRRYRPLLQRLPLRAVREMFEWRRWPVSPITADYSLAGIEQSLRTTRWGRCVYRIGDNDQPSSQTVSILFANGVNAAFTMHGNSYRTMRAVRIDGTRGSAFGHLYALDGDLTVVDHKSGRRRHARLPPTYDGHGGGERKLTIDFLRAVRGEGDPLTAARDAFESHRIAFAAMQSAASGAAVELRA